MNNTIVKQVEKILKHHRVYMVSNYMRDEDAVYCEKDHLVVQVDGLPNLTVLMELAELCSCSLDEIKMTSRNEVLIDSDSTYADITYIKISMPIRSTGE